MSIFKYTLVNFTVRGCLDPAKDEMSCQAVEHECPLTYGFCSTCNGNNCNAAIGMTSEFVISTTPILLGLVVFFGNWDFLDCIRIK